MNIITVELPEQGKGQLRIVNQEGQSIMEKEIDILTNIHNEQLGSYPNGTYFIDFLSMNNRSKTIHSVKIIKTTKEES